MNTADHVRHYRWRDQMLQVIYADLHQASQGDRIFDYHGMEVTGAADGLPGSIDLSLPDSLRAVSYTEDPIARGPDGITLHLGDTGLVLRVDDAIMVTKGARRIEAHCNAAISTGGIDRRLYYILTLGWLSLLQNSGYYGIHAAAVGAPDGDGGVVISGPSDSGKSTASLGLMRRGWKLLSDDSVLLFEAGDSIAAAPLRTDMGFDPEDVDRHHDLATANDSTRQLTDAGKVRVDTRAQFPGGFVEEFVPSILLMPVIVGGESSRLIPASQADAIVGLMQQASFLTREPKVAAKQMAVLNRLVRQCRCFHLQSGDDLLHDPGLLHEMLVAL